MYLPRCRTEHGLIHLMSLSCRNRCKKARRGGPWVTSDGRMPVTCVSIWRCSLSGSARSSHGFHICRCFRVAQQLAGLGGHACRSELVRSFFGCHLHSFHNSQSSATEEAAGRLFHKKGQTNKVIWPGWERQCWHTYSSRPRRSLVYALTKTLFKRYRAIAHSL